MPKAHQTGLTVDFVCSILCACTTDVTEADHDANPGSAVLALVLPTGTTLKFLEMPRQST